MQICFNNVSTPGDTTVEITEPCVGETPDSGFFFWGLSPQGTCYDITTTAGVTFPVTICIHYGALGDALEQTLKIKHRVGSGWQDLDDNTFVDKATNVICANTDGFSVFAVQLPTIDVTAEGWPALDPGGTVDVGVTIDVPPPTLIGAYTVDVAYDTFLITATGCTSIPPGTICNPSFSPGVVRFTGASISGLGGLVEIGTITYEGVGGEGQAFQVPQVQTLADVPNVDNLGIAVAIHGDPVIVCANGDGDASCNVDDRDHDLAAGKSHTCVRPYTLTAQCWGQNFFGRLGDGTTTNSNTPVPVLGLSPAAYLGGADFHSCGTLSNGTVQCWGRNDVGQLGDGTTSDSSTPVTVSGITTAVAVTTGGKHSCAVLEDDTLRCWGSNDIGQLGDGTNTDRLTPVAVSGVTCCVLAVDAGTDHTCALLDIIGSVICWGENSHGQLGDGSTTDTNTPVVVSPLNSVVDISAGRVHSCAVLDDGTAKCWGNNGGQLGDGQACGIISCPIPTTVSGITNAVQISAGGGDFTASHTCAVLDDGGVECWGDNGFGQLGDGTTTDRTTPVSVTGLGGAAFHVAAGGSHTCVLLLDHTVECWGRNASGSESSGGLRNYLIHWDYMDVWTGSPNPQRDRTVSGGDIAAVVARFGTNGLPLPGPSELITAALTPPPSTTGYHAASDRGGSDPQGNVWNLLPPDGVISGGDIAAVVAQFGHTCL